MCNINIHTKMCVCVRARVCVCATRMSVRVRVYVPSNGVVICELYNGALQNQCVCRKGFLTV